MFYKIVKRNMGSGRREVLVTNVPLLELVEELKKRKNVGTEKTELVVESQGFRLSKVRPYSNKFYEKRNISIEEVRDKLKEFGIYTGE
jgi:hypothetical protein